MEEIENIHDDIAKKQQQIRAEIITMRNAFRDLDAGTLEVIELEDVYVIAPTLIGLIEGVFEDMVNNNVWRCLPSTEWVSQTLLDDVDWEEAALPDVGHVHIVDHVAEKWDLSPQRIFHDDEWHRSPSEDC